MCADFQFYLNRQGPRGPKGLKGDKGNDGKTPAARTGIDTPIATTVIFDTGDGNPYETPNLKYPIQDRGGDVVMLDRTNSTQYYGTPDEATDDSYGVVKLATPESILDDPLDNDVVTYKLLQTYSPAVGDGTITVKQGGVTKGTFTTNQSTNQTIELESGSVPSNMVTTDTDQTITGRKTFKSGIRFYDSNSYYIWQAGSGSPITINGGGYNNVLGFTSSGIRINDSYSRKLRIDADYGFAYFVGTQGLLIKTIEVDNTVKNYLQSFGTTLDGKIYRYNSNEIYAPSTLTNFLLESNMLDGETIQYNSTSGKVEVIGGGSQILKKTITQDSSNVSESSGIVTVTDSDVTTSTLVTLYPGDKTTETWLANNMASNIITEGTGSFTFDITESTLPSTFSMYYTIQGVK